MALEQMSPFLRAGFGLALQSGIAGWLVFASAEETDVEKLDS
jgi:hypothetical protein